MADTFEEFLVRARRFVHLTRERKRLQGELRLVEDERAQLQDALKGDFAKGAQAIDVDGMNVHVRRQLWPRFPQGKDKAVQALLDSGMSDLVHPDFNTNTLGATIREMVPRDAAPEGHLPSEWDGLIEAFEKFEVRGTEK